MQYIVCASPIPLQCFECVAEVALLRLEVKQFSSLHLINAKHCPMVIIG